MSESLLNVTSSLMQARWVYAPAPQDLIDLIARQHGLPEIIARLLAARGVAPDQVESFLRPTLARDFPDPLKMAGMKEAAAYIAQAIIDKRKIGVFGDFDVDGATSTAILVRFLRHCGLAPPFYIPDRTKEGYGPNIGALQKLKEQGAEIVIMCDCGITAHEVIAQGRALGLEIVVLDHHQAEEKLPPANHVINPNRRDDTSGFGMLAACGVTFLTCVAVNGRLRELGWFRKQNIAEAPLKDWIDVVALGTVCDMVPLTGPNRLLVRFGLQRMTQTTNTGLRALMTVAGVKGIPTPYHCGFALGPRINAGSRVHQADLGARLLSTDDAEEAKNIAFTLDDCNDKRKLIQNEMTDHAVRMVEDGSLHDLPLIVVGHEDWHPGLSGLVAGKLKEKYGRPAVVVTYAPGMDGRLEGRGSGRSIPGVNMGAAFIDARNKDIAIKGGGHAMAAGFTIMPERLEDLRRFLTDHVSRQLQGQTVVTDTQVDGVVSVRGVRTEFIKLIEDHIGPFGQGHEEPLFALSDVRIHMVDIVGADHVRCVVSDWEGGGRLKAVAFRAAGTPLGDALLKQSRDVPFHIMGHFRINEWQGRVNVEMHIEDAAFAMPQAAKMVGS
jgi:single-stranded-DNA-specific exonuclease